MKIKTKLLIGFGLLFLVVVFFGVVSVYYIEDISENSNKTLKNNYETLTFTREMRAVLDENDLPLSVKAAQAFDSALKKQEGNITEPGEKEATAGVRAAFGQLTNAATANDQQKAEKDIRSGLKTIDGLNMKAVVDKNEHIRATVNNAMLYLGAIVFVTFLILFIFIVNFPGFILNPLNQFISGVHEIGEKNYDARLEFKTGDEFADLAVEFNTMAANLAERDNDSTIRILTCENELKILAEEIPAAVIALNQKQEVLLINPAARKILKIDDKPLNGLPIHDVVKGNHLLAAILESKDGAKISNHKVKNFEIVVPNLKPTPFEALQFASYTAGKMYILTAINDEAHNTVKST